MDGMKRGIATFTLDWGRAPRWLFERMVRLGRQMTYVLVDEYGPDKYIERLADPIWFQSLGTVLAFDWNASGLTTILTAALKEAIRGQEQDLGVFICGGKGKTSRKTPDEITMWGERLNFPKNHVDNLVYNSKMSAKVDSALVQDGYQIYHHSFFFSKNGPWTVVQQGMNTVNATARRYHWYSENIKDLIEEPHSGIASQAFLKNTLDLTSSKSSKNRQVSTQLVSDGFQTLLHDIKIMRNHATKLSKVVAFKHKGEEYSWMKLEDKEFHSHPVEDENFWESKYLERILRKLADKKPANYEEMLSERGVGPKTVRALSLVSEVIYGAKPSYEDPARYSFAHGGKDSTPYTVDKTTYDKTIEIMKEVVRKTHLSPLEKDELLRSLAAKYPSASSFARSSSQQAARYSRANKILKRFN